MNPFFSYLGYLFIAFSILLNALLSPLLNIYLPEDSTVKFGRSKKTLSNVFAHNAPNCTWCEWACKTLSKIDKQHCRKSMKKDNSKGD